MINLSKTTSFHVSVQDYMNIEIPIRDTVVKDTGSFVHVLKKRVSWVGRKALEVTTQREEYHLRPKDGYLQRQTMLLNGKSFGS